MANPVTISNIFELVAVANLTTFSANGYELIADIDCYMTDPEECILFEDGITLIPLAFYKGIDGGVYQFTGNEGAIADIDDDANVPGNENNNGETWTTDSLSGSTGISSIGYGANLFNTSFDGKQHTLSNMYSAHADSASLFNGFFGNVGASAVIHDLNITGSRIIGNAQSGGASSYAGLLFGQAAFGASIYDCNVNGSVIHLHNIQNKYSYAGGVGGAAHCNMYNCVASGSVSFSVTIGSDSGEYSGLGGLVGTKTGFNGTSSYMSNCKSSVSLSTIPNNDPTTVMYVGGLSGYTQAQKDTQEFYTYITNCQFTGSINVRSTTDIYVAGLVASHKGRLSKCYASFSANIIQTNVAATNRFTTFGGLVAITSNGAYLSYVDQCGADFSMSMTYPSTYSVEYVGGIFGQSLEGLITNCYAIGSFDDPTLTGSTIGFNYCGGIGGYGNGGQPVTVSNCFVAIQPYSGTPAKGAFGASFTALTASGNYWDSTTSGITTNNTGATATTTALLKQHNSFPTYDFVNKWGRDNRVNSGYPYLRDTRPKRVRKEERWPITV